MTPEQLPRISVIDPISPTFQRVNTILFKPFDIGKWFVIGFCAWLAYLGSGGGPSFSFSYRQRQLGFEADQAFHQAKEFVLNNLHWLIPTVIAVAVLIIAIGVLITWLSSRGKFMFLHCVALNKAEIKVPWRKYQHQGNSLFLFRIVVGIISFVFFALLIGVMAFIAIIAARTNAHIGAPAIIALILLSLLILVPVVIFFALFWKFTNDFVVPIMYLRASTCTAAWREFWTLLTSNKGRFTIYILFQIVIGLAVGIIGASVGCLFACLLLCFTCGIAGCLMILPPFSIGFGYIMTVLLLPLLVFTRSYSLLYFRQYGPTFDVFTPETEAGCEGSRRL